MITSLLEKLPTELLIIIASELCIHCKDPKATVVPDFGSSSCRQAKDTLAQLCLSSKRMCAVAQPVLFHYFATLPEDEPVMAPLYRARLVEFTRTLYEMPHLAEAVCTVSLVPLPMWKDEYPIDEAMWESIDERERALRGIVKEAEEESAGAGDEAAAASSTMLTDVRLCQMAALILRVATNVDTLVIKPTNALPFGDPYDFAGWTDIFTEPLRKLRVLQLATPDDDQRTPLGDLGALFRLTPALEVFHGPDVLLDCGCWGLSPLVSLSYSLLLSFYSSLSPSSLPSSCDHRTWRVLDATVLSRLRSVTLYRVPPYRLPNLLAGCSGLKELDLNIDTSIGREDDSDIGNLPLPSPPPPPLNGALQALRPHLRRLRASALRCYSRSEKEAINALTFDLMTSHGGQFYDIDMGFSRMDALHILEVDQTVLQVEMNRQAAGSFSSWPRILDVLPRGLRELRIMDVISWKTLRSQLIELALNRILLPYAQERAGLAHSDGPVKTLRLGRFDVPAHIDEDEVEQVRQALDWAGFAVVVDDYASYLPAFSQTTQEHSLQTELF
jgi:hypothetical protein